MTYAEMRAKSYSLRQDVVEMIYRAKTGHIGGDLSVMDILVALYYKEMNVTPENFEDEDHDRFILSKGHSVEALYAVLADKGFFLKGDLKTFSTFDSSYIGHPTRKVRGIEMNSGSLGHGLPVSVGMALAEKMDNRISRVYTVLGDGELGEGSNWEGAMAAGHYKLDNLTAIIDRNGLQISGNTEDVMSQEDMDMRWRGFGWNVLHADGNDIEAMCKTLEIAKAAKGAPTVIIAHTVKGCGVSFIENNASWHHHVPSEQEYTAAMTELRGKEEGLS